MRNLVFACAAIAAISAIVSVNLWRELHAERGQTAQLRLDLAEARLAGAASGLPHQPAPANAQQGGARPWTEAGPVPADAPSAPTVREPAAAERNIAQIVLSQREMLKDPEFRAASKAQQRMMLPQMYPGIAEELGLSAEETSKLFDLLAEFQMQQNETMIPIVNGEQPDPAAMEEMGRRSQEMRRRQDEAVASLLGTGRAQQFKDFQETQSARVQASNIARNLQGTGQALSRTQERELTSAFVTEQRREREEMAAMARNVSMATPADQARMLEQNFERQAQRNRRILDAAKPHLSDTQLQSLQETLDQQLAMNRASSRMFQRQREQQGQDGTPAAAVGATMIMMSP